MGCANYRVARWRVTPEPVIGPRFARTRWAPTRPARCFFRHGRPCAGDARRSFSPPCDVSQDVEGWDKPGHDEDNGKAVEIAARMGIPCPLLVLDPYGNR